MGTQPQTQTQTPRPPPTPTRTKTEQDATGESKVQRLRELFADAPELGKKALENALKELTSQVSEPPPPIESAGRVGARLGKVSELTIIVPLVPGGAKRLRAFLRLLGGNLSPGATTVGTLHDMRFVFLDNDTRTALRHFLRRRLGHLHRRLRHVDSRLSGHHRLAPGKAGRGFAAPRRKTTSSSTRSPQKAGSSPIRISLWLRSAG